MQSFLSGIISKIVLSIAWFLAMILPLTATVAHSLVSYHTILETPPSAHTNSSSIPETHQETASSTVIKTASSTKSAAIPKQGSVKKAPAVAAAAPQVSVSQATSTAAEDIPFPPGVDISRLKAAVVNIICISKDPNLNSMTASGVITDPKGIILTNAHVAQYFLLTDYIDKGLLRCVIRGGNPAHTLYGAELFYIPKQWVQNNTSLLLNDKGSKGTGEDDFALLRINQTVEGESLSSDLPYLQYSLNTKSRAGDIIVAAAYPAEFIPTSDIGKSLYDLSIATKIDELFTFKSATIDLFRMRGSVIAQKGSSGGAVVNTDSNLIGIIATASGTFYNDQRNLYSITIPYIDRELRKFTGGGLDDMLAGNLSRKAVDFSLYDTPALRKLLDKTP